MKKLIIVAIAFIGIQVTAQGIKNHRPNNHQKMMNLSAEEAAKLKTKKMTLFLDLNESQQAEIHKINLENANARKARMKAIKEKKESNNTQKLTKEQRLKMTNAKLDRKIAMKAKMKTILNAEQYTKWEKAQIKKISKGKKKKQGMKKNMHQKK
ncbi:hypothetical protein A8C32_14100 [Flavivirga aquatica]|uniref:DUF4890 domain-containing protein n=1 Tax=Flavivirga aquatica TaxID=1849968 RepID=A0A1E5TCC8_9FLAO|nr:hypothetical protein [Flavivirga aquatica]OEK09021.1 hypothetical protein A8C32_14100 [Flavivirga aquatica]